jgi:hypothetical protein
LIASISRDISPPEAIFDISAGTGIGIGTKKKDTESLPDGVKDQAAVHAQPQVSIWPYPTALDHVQQPFQ